MGGGTVTLFNEFFSGHIIWCLNVSSAVSLKNLKSQVIEFVGEGVTESGWSGRH